MSLYFRSLRSSSGGNCLALWTDNTRVIIDCGLGSIKRTNEILESNLGDPQKIDAVIISHTHSDHISYYPLKALERHGHKVRVHESCLEQLKEKHFNGYGFKSLRLKPFSNKRFRVGDLTFEAFELPHNPRYPTYGFKVRHNGRKVVIATDFHSWEQSLEHFVDADFIFVESNHDLELLRLYFNPNSLFHMSNPRTAELLCSARKSSRKAPQAVMLGHISPQRNEADIALAEVAAAFAKEGMEMDFSLCAAPLRRASDTLKIVN